MLSAALPHTVVSIETACCCEFMVIYDISSIRSELFFFSSRRRHTRYWRDWSSDVCSSDLSTVVMELPKEDLEHRLRAMKERLGVKQDTDVPANGWKELVKEYKANFREKTGKDFPEDPIEQLWGAIGAVFGSWMADKAVTYRRVEKITGLLGTAVNVVQMVFGNTGDNSGTGVCFTRDPSSGEKIFYGDYLVNAQGEDVVAGIRTPMHLSEIKRAMPKV